MKISLWIGFCGLCILAGHMLLGAVGVVLLMSCLPAGREHESGDRKEKAPARLA
ncbi:hypothetical protein [Amycolatopsis decaplanina]|uniref:hypothetical protein n=1 Tax=Amycolatopsis decaplanina TaxID=208441 RepID=UPI00034DCEEB|nr:hypothetical protein [Amycolatopsis decaplanina]